MQSRDIAISTLYTNRINFLLLSFKLKLENTRQINVGELNKALQLKNMVLSNGYGQLKDKTFRIGHMGELTIDDMIELTEAIEEILKLNL